MNKIFFITNYLGRSDKSKTYSSRIRIINNSKYKFLILSNRKINNPFIKFINYLSLCLIILLGVFKDFNLIELHYINPLGPLAVIVKKISGKPLLLFIQGSDLELLPEKYWFFRKLTQYTLKNADRIIVLSKQHRNKLVDSYKVDKDKIVLCKFGPLVEDLVRVEGLKQESNKKKLIFVGSNYIKGGKVFIESFRYLPGNYSGVMVIADRKYRQNMEKIINGFGLKGRIKMFSEMEHRQLVEEISKSDITVIPSKWETLCLVGLESLTIGRPIVGTKVGRIAEYLKPGRNGEFIKREPRDIANKVGKIVSDYSIYQDYLQKNSKRLLEEYNFDSFSNRLDEIRGELMHK